MESAQIKVANAIKACEEFQQRLEEADDLNLAAWRSLVTAILTVLMTDLIWSLKHDR